MNPAGSAFLAALRRFREECGDPPYRRLAAISEELASVHPDRDLPPLSPTAISEILSGRRVDPPSSAWVSSFVLCCQRHAWKIGLLPEDPGLASLPAWHERLKAARAAAETSGAPGRGDAAGREGIPLAPAAHTYVARQGPYGRALVGGLAAGDPEAAYRAAIILAAAPDHRDAAVALLPRAATSRHSGALELLAAEAARFEETVADHACALARAATRRGAAEEAIVFYVSAVLCHSPTGLVDLAALLLAERGREEAATRINAASGGTPPATPQGTDELPASG